MLPAPAPPAPTDRGYQIAEAAAILGLPARTLRQLVREGEFTARIVSLRYVLDAQQVHAYRDALVRHRAGLHDPGYLAPEAVATEVKLTVQAIYKAISVGRLPARKYPEILRVRSSPELTQRYLYRIARPDVVSYAKASGSYTTAEDR